MDNLEIIKELCHANGIGFNRCDWKQWVKRNGFDLKRVLKRISNKATTRNWAYKHLA